MTRKRNPSQLLKFLGAGGVGVLLYYFILYVMTDLLGIWYITSAVTASVVNQATNFTLQKFWTFQDINTTHIRLQAGSYAAMAVALFLANVLMLYLLVDRLGMWYMDAQIVTTLVLTTVSYLLTRMIFSPPAKA